MSKKLVAAIAAVGLAYTGASWYFGKSYEDNTYAIVQNANQDLRLFFGVEAPQIAIADYQRGIFSSTASYSINFEQAGSNESLRLHDQIQHGPIPGLLQGKPQLGLAHSSITLSKIDDYKELFAITQQQSPFQLDTLLSFNLDADSILNVIAIQHTSAKGDKVDFAGAQLQLKSTNNLRDFTLSGEIQPLTIESETDDTQAFRLAKQRLNGRLSDLNGPTQSSEFEYLLEAADVVQRDESKVQLKQFSLKQSDAATDHLLSFNGQYQLQELLIDGQAIGQFTLGFKGKNFDQKIYRELLDLAKVGLQDSPEAQMAAQAKVGFLVLELLNKNPELHLTPISWRNAAGESTLSFNLTLAAPQGLDVLGDPQQAASEILQDVGLSLDLSLPMLDQAAATLMEAEDFAEFKQQLPLLIEQASAEGLIKQEAEQLKLALSFKQGITQLNGQTIAPEELALLFQLLGTQFSGHEIEYDESEWELEEEDYSEDEQDAEEYDSEEQEEYAPALEAEALEQE
ncbi:YdgA family protein [Thiopseudomonas alkaliphila]|uniref:YdgA family protein n=1 Tax=Thiopseudomonas alkaliphila TaxID=1697053 RepID=UPI002575FBBE|nr:YdgA family protein [Thiopseudomonas alkaliphila]MDM1708846.1 YdgA family protein [Thiopseudomonas alkaliphila]